MGAYNPDRISHKLVRYHPSGITVGFNEFIPMSWDDIKSYEPTYWWDTVTIHGFTVIYAHFIFRVLAVHGVQISCSSKPSARCNELNRLIAWSTNQ